MNDLPKNWYASKTIWAAIVAVLLPLLNVLGKHYGVVVPDQSTMVDALTEAGSGIAGLVAVVSRVTASAPVAKPSAPSVKAAIAILMLFAAGSLVACTSQQLARAHAEQQKIEAAVAANAARIELACADVLAVANSSLTDLAAATVPVVGQVQGAVKAGCATADGIAAMARSASTVDWLDSAAQVMLSSGTVLPPPVAPVPVS